MKNTDNYGRPKQEYINKLQKMEHSDLYQETKDKIWLSAYAANNARSDYHWQIDECYNEWKRRNQLGCYEMAYKNVTGEQN